MPLQNAQYDTIMREYDRKQQLHRREMEERQTEAYARVPRLLEINQSIASLSVRAVRFRLSDSLKESIACQDEILKLAKERRELLAANGYPEDYLQMQYDPFRGQ